MTEPFAQLLVSRSRLTRFRALCATWVVGRVVTVIAWRASIGAADSRGFISWDGTAYVSIARHGYTTATDTLFFPLFPWMSRVLAVGAPRLMDVTAILLANLFALLAAWLIAALADEYNLSGGTAAGMAWLAWPAAFVTVIPYPEGLTVCAVCLALLAAARQRWLAVFFFAGAAALSRPTGIIILIPVSVIVFQSARRRILAWGSLLGPFVALACYSIAVRGVGGLQEIFDQQRSAKRRGDVLDPVRAFIHAVEVGVRDRRFGPLLHAGTLLVVATALWLGWKRLPKALWWFAAALAVMTFGASNLDSTERYAMVIVPLFLVAGMLARRAGVTACVLLGGFILQAAYAYATFRGRAVP